MPWHANGLKETGVGILNLLAAAVWGKIAAGLRPAPKRAGRGIPSAE
jgi:hypothetical protein